MSEQRAFHRSSLVVATSFWLLGFGLQTLFAQQLPPAPALPVSLQVVSSQTSFGWSVALLDDLDGDGHGEVMVGTPLWSLQNLEGRVQVFSGSDGTLMYEYFGVPNSTENAGYIVRRLDDYDGDGVDEFGYATQGSATGGPGVIGSKFFVYSGATGTLLQQILVSSIAWPADVVLGGDVDGDGYEDICAAIPAQSISWSTGLLMGGIFVFSGLTGQPIAQISGVAPYHQLGVAAAGVGDINGDGSPDLVVSSLREPNQSPDALNVYAYAWQGNSYQLLYQITTASFTPPAYGLVLEAVDDVDGDGLGDFASPSGAGTVVVFSGATGQQVMTIVDPVVATNTLFGTKMAYGSDFDGDGRADLAIAGACVQSGPQSASPATHIYSLVDGRVLFTVHENLAYPANCGVGSGGTIYFGRSLAGGDDLDGDGMDDLVLAHLGLGFTVVRVYSGAPTISPLWSAGNVSDGAGGTADVFGVSVQGAAQPDYGGPGRAVVTAPGNALSAWMAIPPLAGTPLARYAIFGRLSPPSSHQTWSLPFGIGETCLLPAPLSGGDPTLFTLFDTFGGAGGLVPALPALVPGAGNVVATVPGPPFAVSAVLQGVIEDPSAPAPGLAVTNALRLIVR